VPASRDLPAGTVTFLFTDIEGSTRVLDALGRDRYEDTLSFHNALVRSVLAEHHGIEVDRHGSGFFAVFAHVMDAIAAAVELRRAAEAASWPHDAALKVCLGIHTGDADVGTEGYVGLAVHEAARLAQTADGGHILLSATTAALIGDDLDATLRLNDLGEWPLAGFEGRRRIYSLTADPDHTVVMPSRLRATGDPRLVLLERERELMTIEALVRGNLAEGFVVLEGRAGIGKTRLVQAARDAAADAGLHVLFARGAELEQDFGYGVVRQLFEPVLATATEAERADLLAGPAAFAERLFDESELAAALNAGEDVSFAMLHGLYWLAANVGARAPTLLVVDDLHWADAATLRWLCYLAPRLEGVPLRLFVASRPAEQGREPELLAQILTDPTALPLKPGPLTKRAAATLARELLAGEPEDAFLEAACSATGGNPLFLRALLETLAQEGAPPTAAMASHVHEIGPEAVSRAVGLRMSRLGPTAGRLASAIAVLGVDAEIDQVAALAEIDRSEAHAAAAELARVDLVRVGRPLQFVHPVVRASVYEQIPHPSRPALHRHAADIVAATGGSPERIAAHFLLSEPADDPFVVATLRDAAARSLAQGVSDTAVSYLRRAVEEPPPRKERARVLFELGSAELRVDGRAASDHLREATELEQDPTARAEHALEYGRALWFTGDHVKALDVFTRAIEGLPDDARELRDRLEAEVISSAWWEPEFLPIAVAHLERIRPEELSDGLGSKMLLASLGFMGARRGLEREQSVEYARRSLEGGILQRGNTAAFHYAAFTLAMADYFADALDAYDVSLADARRRGDPFPAAAVHVFRGYTKVRLGDLVEAIDDLRQAVDLARSVENQAAYPYATAFLAQALLESGDVEAADEALRLLPIPQDVSSSGHFFFYRTSRGWVRIAKGEREEGLKELLELGDHIQALHVGNSAWGSWRVHAARALLERGDRERALELAREEVEAQRNWGAPRAIGIALTTLGVVVGGEEGEQHLGEALEILEGSPAKLARARALYELGASLRRRNHRAEGREFLRRALELATACGATGLAEQTREELLASGARPRTTAVSGAEALTPSEARVARMAAEGLTNREIAQALFVTPKTVEVHLSSAYRKLGISSRMQLAEAMAAPAA
jgi:class 3 adenylate cyclase/DNA-binding CsgD family transcriptional regulator